MTHWKFYEFLKENKSKKYSAYDFSRTFNLKRSGAFYYQCKRLRSLVNHEKLEIHQPPYGLAWHYWVD